jgi:hypothetical protein
MTGAAAIGRFGATFSDAEIRDSRGGLGCEPAWSLERHTNAAHIPPALPMRRGPVSDNSPHRVSPPFNAALHMRRPQTLSSGLTIRQDFRVSVRFVMFQTEIEECQYATDGGTVFVVNYRGKVYAVTCGHVVNNFEMSSLIITGEKFPQKGAKHARVRGRYFPSAPQGAATDSDLLDVCIIDFTPDVTPAFFTDPAYVLDENTVCTSHDGHRLLVAGYLKDRSSITEPDIVTGLGLLEYQDDGVASFDPMLRSAISEFAKPAFGRVTGMSGAPVFDLTANALCGMVVRGSMIGNKSTVHFLDAFHIVEMLKAIHRGASGASYTRGVWQKVRLPEA